MSPRKKEFDPDYALERAMQVFWSKGYDATSVQDLVDAMGINRFSMYDTFGSKHELFCAACRRYFNQIGLPRLRLIRESSSGLDGIRKFFQVAIDFFAIRDGRRGCLMTNTAAELSRFDDDVTEIVTAFFDGLTKEFYRALVKARESKEIRKDLDLRKSSYYLTSSAQGIWVLGKVCPKRKDLENVVEMVMSALI